MGYLVFEKNTRVNLDGATYVLRRMVSDTAWHLEDLRTGRPIVKERDELLLHLMNSELSLQRQSTDPPPPKSKTTLTSAEKDQIMRRLKYVRATEGLAASQKSYERAIAEVWRLQRGCNLMSSVTCTENTRPPHWTTVYRWGSRYKRFGCDALALLDRPIVRRSSIDEEVLEICREGIDTVYLKLERQTIEDTLDYAKHRVLETNEMRAEQGRSLLPQPTRRVLTRLIAGVPAFDRYAARHGHIAALAKFRSVKGHRSTRMPLERAEIDHTPLDLFVVDELQSLPLGRPWLTLCVDDFTRCILGVYVGFVPPSYQSVALCLQHAFMPKFKLKSEFPMINNDWVSFGVPRELVVDQALEFHSESLEQAMLRLGVEIHYSPRKQPWFKGKVEKLVGQMNKSVAHGTRGTTFSNTFEKGDYKPEKHAHIPLSILRAAIHKWICDIYHPDYHRVLGTSPENMWKKYIKQNEIKVPEDPRMLDVVMGRRYTRTATHKGIELEGLLYNSQELTALRYRIGSKLRAEISVNENDVGSINVICHGEILQVPALNLEYADGISMYQHKLFRKKAPWDTPEGWLKAKEDLRQMMAKVYRKSAPNPLKGAGRAIEGQSLALSGSSEPLHTDDSTHSQGHPNTISICALEEYADGEIPNYEPVFDDRNTND
jgi:putative transposase